MLVQERNIASTHALFKRSNDRTIELVKAGNYILILDEVMDVVEKVKLKKHDLKVLKESGLISIDKETSLVTWDETKLDYQTKYDDIKEMSLRKSLFLVNDTFLLWTLPVEIFNAFKEVYVMTYMFDSQIQRYYYDLYNVRYKYYYVDKEFDRYVLKQKDKDYKEDKTEIKSFITIIHEKINNIGDEYNSLSVSWCERNKRTHLAKKFQKNIDNFFKNKRESKAKDAMWTVYMSIEDYIKLRSLNKGFVPCTARATNEYSHKHNLSYCVNMFLILW